LKLFIFNSSEVIEIKSSNDVQKILLPILRRCNPLMKRHYQSQFKRTIIRGYGKEIELERAK